MGGRESIVARRVVIVSRSTRGFCQGVFLQTAALVILNRLTTYGFSELFGLAPVQWVAFLFALGVFLGGVFEIPTGVLADILGRRKAVLLSLCFFALTFLFFAGVHLAPDSKWVLLLAAGGEFTYALYFTLINGAFLAWLSDHMSDRGNSEHVSHMLFMGQNWYHVCFLVGSLLGMAAFLTGHILLLYTLAALLCLAATIPLTVWMDESPKMRSPQSLGMVCFLRRSVGHCMGSAWQGLRQNKSLCALFLTQAMVVALVGVVGYLWPVVAHERFSFLDMSKLSWHWMALTLVLGLSTLLGNWLFSRYWLRKACSTRNQVTPLVGFYSAFTLLIAVPILILSHYGDGGQSPLQFTLFMSLLAWHRAIPSVLTSLSDSLKHALIQSGERATILSFGSFLEHVAGALLMGISSVFSDAGLTLWFFAALTVLLSTVGLCRILLDSQSESHLEPYISIVQKEVVK